MNFMIENHKIQSQEFYTHKLNKTNLHQAASCTINSNHLNCLGRWNKEYETKFENVSIHQSQKKIPNISHSKAQDVRLIDTIIEKHNSENLISSISIDNIPKNKTCIKNEPSAASNGISIVYTGNHYAAISKYNKTDWNFIDPGYKFPFCCDQRVIYDENNRIFIWYIQGEQTTANLNDNFVRLAISRDAITWELYQFEPGYLGHGLFNTQFDFPNLSTDNSFLYLTTNLLNYKQTHEPGNKGSLILRVPLQELRTSVESEGFQDINPELFRDPKARTITPVKGATNEMYLATILINENKMRIYSMNQSSYLKQYDTDLHGFIPLYRHGTLDCGKNSDKWGWWCGSFDSKITTGWIDNDKIGFLWNANKFVNQSNIYPVPYVDGAIFDINDNMKEVARPYLSNSNLTLAFADVAFNGNKDLGLVAFYGNKTNVNLAFGVYDKSTNPHWKMMSLLNSTEKITSPLFDPAMKKCYSNLQKIDSRQYQWGDYITINKYPTNNSLWEIAAYIMTENDWHGALPYYLLVKN